MDSKSSVKTEPPSTAPTTPQCQHHFHSQTLLSPLPPLYISPSLNTPLRPSTLSKLSRALTNLGTPRTHTPFLNRDIIKLRKELENGMGKERRQMMQFYVLGIEDRRKRAATELYLARYKGFEVGGDGRLGFGLEEGGGLDAASGGNRSRGAAEMSELERVQVRKAWKMRAQACGVM